jgi:hypothetical protein
MRVMCYYCRKEPKMKIAFPDGSEREVIKASHASKLIESRGLNPWTFLRNLTREKIPSVKLGASRYVEVAIVDQWTGSVGGIKSEPIFTGYNF